MTVITGMTMSLDGFVADRHGDASPLYPDLTAFKDNEILQESIDSTGAVVMGRSAYEMAEGDLTGFEYQVPIFVLTHHPPEKAPKGQSEGGLTVKFVTNWLERAMEKAKSAAVSRTSRWSAARTSPSNAFRLDYSTSSISPSFRSFLERGSGCSRILAITFPRSNRCR